MRTITSAFVAVTIVQSVAIASIVLAAIVSFGEWRKADYVAIA